MDVSSREFQLVSTRALTVAACLRTDGVAEGAPTGSNTGARCVGPVPRGGLPASARPHRESPVGASIKGARSAVPPTSLLASKSPVVARALVCGSAKAGSFGRVLATGRTS